VGWQVVNATVLHAGNTIINPNGIFVYSGAPAAGNLIASSAPAAGTDQFGNAYLQGDAAYVTISGSTYALRLGQTGTVPAFFLNNQSSPPFFPPAYSFTKADPTGCGVEMASGQALNTSVASGVICQDSTLAGIVNGVVAMICGQVQMGNSGAAVWNDNTQQLNLPPGGGPFILSEGFHDVSGGVGGVTARVKKLPWNAIWIDVEATEAATGTFTLASLPDATYYPTQARHFAIGATASVVNARLFIPTSGAIQIIVGGTGAWSGGCSVMYPNN
jgi:hypothetical protein